MIRFSVTAAVIVGFTIAIGCTNNKKQTLLGNICDTTDTRFSTVVNPIIISECLSCHSNSNAVSEGGGISLEGYANVNAYYQQILSDINSGRMPWGKSKLDDCTILKIQTWVNRGAKND
jgi:uncharacterized membrane protein